MRILTCPRACAKPGVAAKSFDEMTPWFTPERRSASASQAAEMAGMGDMPELFINMYTMWHSRPPAVTAPSAIGAAAVLTSASDADGARQTCQTLMLQRQGAWKVGEERCTRQGGK